jgi:hypothetical protein
MLAVNGGIMETATQRQKILRALEHGAALTPLDALRRFSCFRLGARIWELKRMGHKIETRRVKREGARVAEYRLAR